MNERLNGFVEKGCASARFFCKGKIGLWHDELTPEKAQRIADDHREVMQRFGYLDEKGRSSIERDKTSSVESFSGCCPNPFFAYLPYALWVKIF